MTSLSADEFGPLYHGAYCPRCHEPISYTRTIDGYLYYCLQRTCDYAFWEDTWPTHENPVWLAVG